MKPRSFLATALVAATAVGGSALLLGAAAPSSDPAVDRTGSVAAPTSTPTSSGARGLFSEADGPAGAAAQTVPDDTTVVVLPGDGAVRPDPRPVEPLGEVDVKGFVPAGLDLTAFPGAPSAPATSGFQGADSFSAGWGCAIQCVTKGVAYPRGFGAELVVETSVDADIFVSVIGDADGDGDYEYSNFEWSNGPVDHLSWTVDDLDPGQTYYAMVSAQDSQGGHSLAFGVFTTLSHREAYVSLGDLTITGGKDDDGVRRALSVDGWWSDYTPGSEGIHRYTDLDGTVDLRLSVFRDYDGDICEAQGHYDDLPAHGYSSVTCTAWNSADVIGLDLDVVPAGATRWTETEAHATIQTSAGGGALPTGYGEPYFFHFSAPVTFWVQYS